MMLRYLAAVCLFVSINNVQALDIQQWQTPTGAKVLFVQTSGLPMLDIQLNFDAASARDGEQLGVANITNQLIATATQYQDEAQILAAFEAVGAQFSRHSLKDMAMVSLRTLTKKDALQQALRLFSEVLSVPKFEQKYLTRVKRRTLRAIEAGQQSPANVAVEAFNQAVFGLHPYAHPSVGNKRSIQQISLAAVKRHYQKYYVAKNLTIALVGDISRAQAKQIARQLSHGLNRGKKPAKLAVVSPLTQDKQQHIEFPSQQTHVLIGQTGINRTHPDYYALYLGNHILGGNGLRSLLSQEVREKNGLAYSVSSYLAKMAANGYFLITLQTKNAQAQYAKTLVLDTLHDFLTQPIDAQTLQEGKDNIIGGFALQTASNSHIVTYLSIIGFYDLPLGYLNGFVDKIKPISAAAIQKAFNRLIDMDRLVVLSVGQQS